MKQQEDLNSTGHTETDKTKAAPKEIQTWTKYQIFQDNFQHYQYLPLMSRINSRRKIILPRYTFRNSFKSHVRVFLDLSLTVTVLEVFDSYESFNYLETWISYASLSKLYSPNSFSLSLKGQCFIILYSVYFLPLLLTHTSFLECYTQINSRNERTFSGIYQHHNQLITRTVVFYTPFNCIILHHIV